MKFSEFYTPGYSLKNKKIKKNKTAKNGESVLF